MSRDTDERTTPLWFYERLDIAFEFHLDPCTTAENPLGARFHFTREDDGLLQDWKTARVYVNPPYSSGQVWQWLRKSREEADRGAIVVVLTSCDSSTEWAGYIYDHANEVIELDTRLKFGGGPGNGVSPAPFGSILSIWLPYPRPPGGPIRRRWVNTRTAAYPWPLGGVGR